MPVNSLSQSCEITSSPTSVGLDVAAQEGGIGDVDELMKGLVGAEYRRGNGGSGRDGWDEDSSSCFLVGSHGDLDSVVSDPEAGQFEYLFNSGL